LIFVRHRAGGRGRLGGEPHRGPSFSRRDSYWRRRAIDPALALVLLSRTICTALGVSTFTLLRSLGQLDLTIALSYVVLLTSVDARAMFYEGLRAYLRARRGSVAARALPAAMAGSTDCR